MALVQNTIERVFTTYTGAALAAAADQNYAAMAIEIPETSSRTFRSVYVIIGARDANAATASRGSLTDYTIGVTLGAAAESAATITASIADTGEQLSFLLSRDVTSYFQTNYSGTSTNLAVRFRFSQAGTNALTLNNIWCKVVITYDYDDVGTNTRIKTVRIPLESPAALLTNTLTQIGTNQVPNLSTFLPEASKTYRDIFFEVCANEANTTATTYQLQLALDAEGASSSAVIENANSSSPFFAYVWKRTDMTTNATHAFNAASTVTSRFADLVVCLVVTYEYDAATTTSAIQSLLIPFVLNGDQGGISSGNTNRIRVTVPVAEPATIALVQSGVSLFYQNNANNALTVGIGAQATRAYNGSMGTITAGSGALCQRIDAGSVRGAALTLARGNNNVDINFYSTTDQSSHVSGWLILNYTSGVAADGIGRHSRTCLHYFGGPSTSTVRRREITGAIPLPETSYKLMAAGLIGYMQPGRDETGATLGVQYNSGEGPGAGWFNAGTIMVNEENERSLSYEMYDFTAMCRPDTKSFRTGADVEASRVYRYVTVVASTQVTLVGAVTYHAIEFPVTGTVTGYTGNGSGILVEIHRTDTDEKVAEATTSAGGGYSTTIFDNSVEHYAHAQQGTRAGRSLNGTG